MKSNFISYNFEKSRTRVNDILKTDDKSYIERDSIPSRDMLSYTNGFYVNKTSAIFVDIRDSSNLPSIHKRKVLARIYRSYISEVVAIINGNSHCAEIGIDGDAVWGIFDAQYKNQIDALFNSAAQVSSVIEYINCQLQKKSITPIKVGVGLSFGRALMIKAGYNGSGIHEVVWMGDVMNEAANLCSFGNKTSSDYEVMISEGFFDNLNKKNQSLLGWNNNRDCYHGNVINIGMNNWLKKNNCK